MKIQNANGAGLEDLTTIPYTQDSIVIKLGDCSVNVDTIDINPSAETGKKYVDIANTVIETIEASVRKRYNGIVENLTVGIGRDKV